MMRNGDLGKKTRHRAKPDAVGGEPKVPRIPRKGLKLRPSLASGQGKKKGELDRYGGPSCPRGEVGRIGMGGQGCQDMRDIPGRRPRARSRMTCLQTAKETGQSGVVTERYPIHRAQHTR